LPVFICIEKSLASIPNRCNNSRLGNLIFCNNFPFVIHFFKLLYVQLILRTAAFVFRKHVIVLLFWCRNIFYLQNALAFKRNARFVDCFLVLAKISNLKKTKIKQ